MRRAILTLAVLLGACDDPGSDMAGESTGDASSDGSGEVDGSTGGGDEDDDGTSADPAGGSDSGSDGAVGWGGDGESDGDSGSTGSPEPTCDVARADLARNAIASCPQLADGAPDHACIADALPEECLVESLDDDTEACLFGGLGYPNCPLPSLDGMCAN